MRRKYQPIYKVIRNISFQFGIMFILILGIWLIQSCNGEDNQPTKPETSTVTDHEGHTYRTVKIGDQWWMAENLNVSTFRTGVAIPLIEAKNEWSSIAGPAYTNYNNAPNGTGKLYNLAVVQSGEEIAPEGWRVASDEDWKILESYLGMAADELEKTNWRGLDEGDQLKEETTTTSGWIFHDGIWGNNSSGFSAIGGSCRVFNGEWGVPGLRHSGFWWTSTPNENYGWYRYLDYQKSQIFRFSAHPNYGFSVRCVKN